MPHIGDAKTMLNPTKFADGRSHTATARCFELPSDAEVVDLDENYESATPATPAMLARPVIFVDEEPDL